MSWRTDLIAEMTAEEAKTVLALVAGGHPEAFDWVFGGLGGSLAERFRRAVAEAAPPADRKEGGNAEG